MEFRDFSDVLDELAAKWINLSTVEKNAVATALGGTRQRENFNILMENYDSYKEAIETASDSAGTAEEKYEAYTESLEYSVKKLQAAWEGFAQSLEASPVIKFLTDFATKFVENIGLILNQFLSLTTALNAYKIPTWFRNLGDMFGPSIGKSRGFMPIFTGAGQAQRMIRQRIDYNESHGLASDDGMSGLSSELAAQGEVSNKLHTKSNTLLTQIKQATSKICGAMGIPLTAEQAAGAGQTTPSVSPTSSLSPINSHQRVLNGIAYGLAQTGTGSLGGYFRRNIGHVSGLFGNFRATDKEKQEIERAFERYKSGNENLINQKRKEYEERRYNPSIPNDIKESYREAAEQEAQYMSAFRMADISNVTRGKLVVKGTQYKYDKNTQQYMAKQRNGTWALANIDAETKEQLDTAQAHAKFRKKAATLRVAGASAVSGITAAISQEGDVGDKAVAGISSAVSTGLLSAIPGVGTIIGPILGPILGDWVTKGLLRAIHKDEIEREARVENSQAILEALKELSSTMEEVGNNIVKGVENWTSEDFETQQGLVKEIKSALYILDDESTENIDESANAKELREALAEELQKLPENIQKLITGDSDKVTSSYSDLTSALDILASGGEGAEEINAALMAAQYRQQAQALWGSQEEERYQAIQAMSDNYRYLSALESVKDTEVYESATEEEKQDFDEYQKAMEDMLGNAIETYENARATLEELDKEVSQNNMMSAFYSSGVSQVSTLDIGEASLEGTRLKILKDWAKIDSTIMNQDKSFTQEAINMVNDFLRTQENFSSLFDSSNLTFGEVFDTKNKAKRENVITALKNAGYSVSNFQDVLDLASKNTEESQQAMTTAAKVLGTTVEKVVDDLFNLEASNRQSFASAFGTSTKFIEDNLGALQNLKLEDILNGLDGLNSRYEDIASIFDDIAQDLIISQENLDMIMEKYSFLMYGEDEKGNVTFSQGNILQNIVDMVVGKGSEASLAYASAIISDANNSTDAFDALRKKFGDNWSVLFGGNLTEEELQILNSEDATMSSIMSSSLFQKMGDEIYSEWGKIVSQLVGESEYMSMLQEAVYEYGSHLAQKEIDNLESIKDNLDAINETREKELALIKAKDKLENTKNEKKMVYRSGIGWVFESDQTAVQEAKQELDSLEVEKEQDYWQYQIDQLTKIQDRLENSDTEEELRGFKEVFEAWSVGVAEDIGAINTKDIVSTINNLLTWFQEDFSLNNVQDQVQDIVEEEMEEGKNQNLVSHAQEVASAYNELKKAEAEIGNTADNSIERANAIENYNEVLKKYNETVQAAKTAGLTSENFNSIIQDKNNQISISENGSVSDLSSLYSGETATSSKEKPKEFRYILRGAFMNETNLNDPDQQKYAHATFTQEPWEQDTYKWWYDNKDKTWILPYPYTGSWLQMSKVAPLVDSPEDLISLLSSYGDYTVVASMAGGDEFGYFYNGLLYKIRDSRGWDKFSGNTGAAYQNYVDEIGGDENYWWGNATKNKEWANRGDYTVAGADSNASGSISYSGGLSYINEEGLEGIITPHGTLTSLPAKTGIVPADLTRNLYNLGEVAPNLVKMLDSVSSKYPDNNSAVTNNDNSTFIQNLYATFQAEENFDFDKFLSEVRGVVNTTRHSG